MPIKVNKPRAAISSPSYRPRMTLQDLWHRTTQRRDMELQLEVVDGENHCHTVFVRDFTIVKVDGVDVLCLEGDADADTLERNTRAHIQSSANEVVAAALPVLMARDGGLEKFLRQVTEGIAGLNLHEDADDWLHAEKARMVKAFTEALRRCEQGPQPMVPVQYPNLVGGVSEP